MKYFLTISCFLLLQAWVYSQKVGLVLSGGGPRGVTHIGVLKALEEEEIPIDYIAGTSMGAIIGGLYASGYSPKQMEDLFTQDDLTSWLSGHSEPNRYYFFKHSQKTSSWQIFRIGYDSVFRAQLPTNIVSPFEMDFGFLELFTGVSAAAGNNFDSLMVPFRCIASDIANSRQVVMKSGQLEKAIRASMTFPFYFKPVTIEGKLMFDGGMYNNFPVDVLNSEFNPDVIIGVKAASNFDPPDENDIISQIQSMLMTNTDYIVEEEQGVLIEPNLWPVNITDFSNNKTFIDSGYVAAKRKIDLLKNYIDHRITKTEIDQKRSQFRKKIPQLAISKIRFTGLTPDQNIYMNKLVREKKFIEKLNRKYLPDHLVLKEIKKQYYQILAEEQIGAVEPSLVYHEPDKAYHIIYNISRSNMLEAELGGLVSSRAINEIFFQLKYNRWKKNMLQLFGNAYLGRFHNSGHVSARLDIPFSVPLSFELSYTLNGWNYFNTSTYFFEDEDLAFLVQQDNYWSFELSAPLTRAGKISAQWQAGRKKDEYYQTNLFSRGDTTDVTFFDFYSPAIIFEINTLNRKQYASRGQMVKIGGRFIGGREKNIPGSTSFDTVITTKYHRWLQLRFNYDAYFPLARRLKLGFYADAALSKKTVFANYTSSILSAPAFEPLPESQTIFLPHFRAHNFVGTGLKIIVPTFRNIDFRAEGYAFQPFREVIKKENNVAELGREFDRRYFILSGRLVYHAPFGPVSAGIDYYDNASDPYYFNFNVGYYIFNPRPFH